MNERCLVIIPQFEVFTSTLAKYNIYAGNKISLVETLLIIAEEILYSGEKDITIDHLTNAYLDADFPYELITAKTFKQEMMQLFVDMIHYLLNHVLVLDLPNGLKHVVDIDDYKIVIEVTNLHIPRR